MIFWGPPGTGKTLFAKAMATAHRRGHHRRLRPGTEEQVGRRERGEPAADLPPRPPVGPGDHRLRRAGLVRHRPRHLHRQRRRALDGQPAPHRDGRLPPRGPPSSAARRSPAERHAGAQDHRGGGGQPEAPANRSRRPDPHPLVRPRRAADGAEHPRGLRPPEGAGQGALPRRQHAHAEPRGGGERRHRFRTLRRHDARLPLRHVAELRAHPREGEDARRRRGGDEDAERRQARQPGPFQDQAGAYSQAAFRWVLSNPDVSCLVDLLLRAPARGRVPGGVRHRAAAGATSPSSSGTTSWSRATTASRTAASASTPARTTCRSTTCSAIACTSSDYGWREEGVRKYALLPATHRASASAAPRRARGSCPIGVPIREKMLDAHYICAGDTRRSARARLVTPRRMCHGVRRSGDPCKSSRRSLSRRSAG